MSGFAQRHLNLLTALLIAPLTLLLGYSAAAGRTTNLVAVGIVGGTAGAVSLLGGVRSREVVLWIVVAVGVFNFTAALFKPTDLTQEPLVDKAIKDVALALLLVTAAVLPRPDRQLLPMLQRKLDAFALVLICFALLMLFDYAVRSPVTSGFVASFRYYALYPLVAIVLPRFQLTRTETVRVLKVAVILGAVEGVIAVLDFFRVIGSTYYANYVFLGGGAYSRAIGTLGNPDNLALFLGLPAILLMFGHLFSWRKSVLLLAPVLSGLALSFSKTGAMAFGLAALLQTRGSRSARLGKVRLLLIAAISVAFAYLAITGRQANAPSSLFGTRAESISRAFHEWVRGARSFVIGNGIGSQSVAVAPDRVQDTVTDNMALTLAVEGGMVAVAAFTTLVVLAVRMLATVRRMSPFPEVNGLWGFAIFFLLSTPILVNFRVFPDALFFWVAIGLAIGLLPREGPRRGERRMTAGVALRGRKVERWRPTEETGG